MQKLAQYLTQRFPGKSHQKVFTGVFHKEGNLMVTIQNQRGCYKRESFLARLEIKLGKWEGNTKQFKFIQEMIALLGSQELEVKYVCIFQGWRSNWEPWGLLPDCHFVVDSWFAPLIRRIQGKCKSGEQRGVLTCTIGALMDRHVALSRIPAAYICQKWVIHIKISEHGTKTYIYNSRM